MNEQKQAERLAAWLEDANSIPGEDGTPADRTLDGLEELDADVRETLIALRPELAPAPRVSVDDILAGVTEGPLAAAPTGSEAEEDPKSAMPMGASVGASPQEAPLEGSSRSRRPWLFAALGVGGMGSLVAAAAVLLVVGSVTMNSQNEPAVVMDQGPAAAPMRASEPMDDAVAMEEAAGVVDTGLRKPAGDADAARKPRAATPRPRPSPKPRPASAAQVAKGPTTSSPAELGDAPEAEPDAVAFADDELAARGGDGTEGGDVYDDALGGSLEAIGYLDEDVPRNIPEVPSGGLARDEGRGAGKGSGTRAAAEKQKAEAKADEPVGDKLQVDDQRQRAEEAARKQAEEQRRLEAERAAVAAEEAEELSSAGAAAPAMEAPADRDFNLGGQPVMSESDMTEPMADTPSASRPRPRADIPAAEERAKRTRSPLFGGRKSKEAKQAPSAPTAAPPAAPPAEPAPPPPPPTGSSNPKARQARQGVESTTSSEIRAAQSALDAGSPRIALGKIEAALAAGPSTAVRQHLLALKGDALWALGDRKAAEAAWDAAIALQTGP